MRANTIQESLQACAAALFCQRVPGHERIYTCGEKEYLAWQKYKDKGVALDPVLQQQLRAMRDELGLAYTFPFEI